MITTKKTPNLKGNKYHFHYQLTCWWFYLLFFYSPTIEDSKAKYKSPLFTQYLIEPIQPIKISEALKNTPKTIEVPEVEEIKETILAASSIEIENNPQPLSIMKPETLNLIKPKNMDDVDNSPPIPGSIAEREHLKWLKAIPIENNPYSPEALQKRLSRTHDKHFDMSPDKHADEVPSNYFDERQLTDDITKYVTYNNSYLNVEIYFIFSDTNVTITSIRFQCQQNQ